MLWNILYIDGLSVLASCIFHSDAAFCVHFATPNINFIRLNIDSYYFYPKCFAPLIHLTIRVQNS